MGKNLVKRVTSKAILDVFKEENKPMNAGLLYNALNKRGYGIYKKGKRCMTGIYITLIEMERKKRLTSSKGANGCTYYELIKSK